MKKLSILIAVLIYLCSSCTNSSSEREKELLAKENELLKKELELKEKEEPKSKKNEPKAPEIEKIVPSKKPTVSEGQSEVGAIVEKPMPSNDQKLKSSGTIKGDPIDFKPGESNQLSGYDKIPAKTPTDMAITSRFRGRWKIKMKRMQGICDGLAPGHFREEDWTIIIDKNNEKVTINSKNLDGYERIYSGMLKNNGITIDCTLISGVKMNVKSKNTGVLNLSGKREMIGVLRITEEDGCQLFYNLGGIKK